MGSQAVPETRDAAVAAELVPALRARLEEAERVCRRGRQEMLAAVLAAERAYLAAEHVLLAVEETEPIRSEA